MTEFSLVVLRRGDEFLFAKKARKIGAGYWNGYGGKREPGETLLECAKRELFEESCVLCEDLVDAGVFVCRIDGEADDMRVHMFVGEKWEGVPQETPEMLHPTWFRASELPYSEMFPSVWYWFPFVCRRQRIAAEFHGPNCSEIDSAKIEVVGTY